MGFSGGLSGTVNPQYVTMNQPVSVLATFGATHSVTSTRSAPSFGVDGTACAGGTCVFAPQTGGDTLTATQTAAPTGGAAPRYEFSTTDGSVAPQAIFAPFCPVEADGCPCDPDWDGCPSVWVGGSGGLYSVFTPTRTPQPAPVISTVTLDATQQIPAVIVAGVPTTIYINGTNFGTSAAGSASFCTSGGSPCNFSELLTATESIVSWRNTQVVMSVAIDPVDPQADAGPWWVYLNVPFWITAAAAASPSMGSFELEAAPTVVITGPQGVPQGGSDVFTVTVSGPVLDGPVTINLNTTQGTGSATFGDGTTSTMINSAGTVNLTVKGVQASSTANNLAISASFGDEVLTSQQFSVVSVSIGLNIGAPAQTDAQIADFLYYVGGSKPGLGAELYYGGPGTQVQECIVGVELIGTVTPGNYTGPVTLRRTVVGSAIFQGQVPCQTCDVKSAGTDDTSANSLLDDTVGAGAPSQVFDLDPPGTQWGPSPSTPRRFRTNFSEYAVLGDRSSTAQAGPSFPFYVAVSCGGTAAAPALDYTASSNDNAANPNSIPLTWNLQN